MKQFICILIFLLPFCAFSQVNESFDSPQITDNYPWRSTNNNFYLSKGRLCLDISGRDKGSDYLMLDIDYSSSMEWESDVFYTFEPTANNHARLYVYATGKPSDEAFYIQVGGSSRNVIFSKNANGKDVPLIKGETGRVLTSWGQISVRLTLEDNKRWVLYSKLSTESSYKKEGEYEAPLKDIREKGVFNVGCKFQAKSFKDYIVSFDNIHIAPLSSSLPDTPDEGVDESLLPKLLDLDLYSLNNVWFMFDKPVDIADATFGIEEIGVSPSVRYVDESSKKEISAVFMQEMKEGNSYTIFYDNLRSLDGKKMSKQSRTISITSSEEDEDAASPTEVAVVVNEIMADPIGLIQLPETEYIELFNKSDKNVNLTGYYLVYGTTYCQIDNLVIPARGFAVLYRAGRSIKLVGEAVDHPMTNFPANLANTGKELMIADKNKVALDKITYSKATPAKSWERKDNTLYLCNDIRGGTPGAPNSSSESVTPDPDIPGAKVSIDYNEVVVNEILPEPYVGGSEFIELFNRTDRDISLSNAGVALRKSEGTLYSKATLSDQNVIIKKGGYLLLTKNLDDVSSFYSLPTDLNHFEPLHWPILNNLGSTIVLYNLGDESVIDEVSYSSSWHSSMIKDKKGVSLERISPDEESNRTSNWTSASELMGFASPGMRNSQITDAGGGSGSTSIEAPVWREETQDYIIRYLLAEAGYSGRIYIYNTAGQRMSVVADHQFFGTSGELIWNGTSTNGSALSSGIYIFYAELYHPSGDVKHFKKAFVLK